jgi:hypothetical protein
MVKVPKNVRKYRKRENKKTLKTRKHEELTKKIKKANKQKTLKRIAKTLNTPKTSGEDGEDVPVQHHRKQHAAPVSGGDQQDFSFLDEVENQENYSDVDDNDVSAHPPHSFRVCFFIFSTHFECVFSSSPLVSSVCFF